MSKETKKLLVRCTYEIEVEVQAEWDDLEFLIEENGCPGTGAVGSAFDRNYEQSRAEGICWACRLGGTNQIVAKTALDTPQPPADTSGVSCRTNIVE